MYKESQIGLKRVQNEKKEQQKNSLYKLGIPLIQGFHSMTFSAGG